MANLMNFNEVKRDFSKRKIDTSQVGFYDSPAFIRVCVFISNYFIFRPWSIKN